LLAGLITLTLAAPLIVRADGIAFPLDWSPVKQDLIDQTNQQAFINYEDGLEKMIISVGLDRENKDAVWIFPVSSPPEDVVIDVLKKMPELRGINIREKAEFKVPGIMEILRLTQIYPFFLFYRSLSKIARLTAEPLTIGEFGAGAGADLEAIPEPEVVVHEHLEKEGMTLELITAKRAGALYDYLKEKGLEVEEGSIPVLDEYIGKDYSFVVSWITSEEMKAGAKIKEVKFFKAAATSEAITPRPKLFIEYQETGKEKTVEVTLQPGSEQAIDTTIRDDYPEASIGSGDGIDVGHYLNYLRGLIKFNLDKIPENVLIKKAILTMVTAKGISRPCTVNIHRLKQYWIEGTGKYLDWGSDGASWNTYDGINRWTNSGGDYDFTIEASQDISQGKDISHTFDITNLVQGWVKGTYPNYGLLLEADSSLDYTSFYSSDFSGTVTPSPWQAWQEEPASKKKKSELHLWQFPEELEVPTTPESLLPGKEQRGIFITFPAPKHGFYRRKIYYPLIPTSIYESKTIPIEIRVLGFVKPRIYSKIKGYTEVSYWEQDYTKYYSKKGNWVYAQQINLGGFEELEKFGPRKLVIPEVPEELKDFYGSIDVKGRLAYTKIKINAPSKYLVDDLWMKRGTPVKISLALAFSSHPIIMGVLLLVILSFLAGLWSAAVVFRKRVWKYGLLGLTNTASIIGLMIGTAAIRTERPQISEKAREMLEEMKKAGVRVSIRDKRKLYFVLLFTFIFVLLTYLVENLLKWYF